MEGDQRRRSKARGGKRSTRHSQDPVNSGRGSKTLGAMTSTECAQDPVDLMLRQWDVARPDLDFDVAHVTGRIIRVSRLLERELAPTYQPVSLDLGLYNVLMALRRAPDHELSPRDLNQWCMLTSGAMTARLHRLETAGLIERTSDPDDGRGVKVRLSAEGFALIDELMVQDLKNAERILSELSPRERRALAWLLKKLALSLGDRIAGEKFARGCE